MTHTRDRSKKLVLLLRGHAKCLIPFSRHCVAARHTSVHYYSKQASDSFGFTAPTPLRAVGFTTPPPLDTIIIFHTRLTPIAIFSSLNARDCKWLTYMTRKR